MRIVPGIGQPTNFNIARNLLSQHIISSWNFHVRITLGWFCDDIFLDDWLRTRDGQKWNTNILPGDFSRPGYGVVSAPTIAIALCSASVTIVKEPNPFARARKGVRFLSKVNIAFLLKLYFSSKYCLIQIQRIATHNLTKEPWPLAWSASLSLVWWEQSARQWGNFRFLSQPYPY